MNLTGLQDRRDRYPVDRLLQAVIDGASRDLHDLVHPVILSKDEWRSRDAGDVLRASGSSIEKEDAAMNKTDRSDGGTTGRASRRDVLRCAAAAGPALFGVAGLAARARAADSAAAVTKPGEDTPEKLKNSWESLHNKYQANKRYVKAGRRLQQIFNKTQSDEAVEGYEHLLANEPFKAAVAFQRARYMQGRRKQNVQRIKVVETANKLPGLTLRLSIATPVTFIFKSLLTSSTQLSLTNNGVCKIFAILFSDKLIIFPSTISCDFDILTVFKKFSTFKICIMCEINLLK